MRQKQGAPVVCNKCDDARARYHAAFNMLKKWRDAQVAANTLELEIRAFMVAEDNKAPVKESEEPTIKDLASALKKLGISEQILKLIADAEAGIPADAVPPKAEE